jgi:hypothetical protein
MQNTHKHNNTRKQHCQPVVHLSRQHSKGPAQPLLLLLLL